MLKEGFKKDRFHFITQPIPSQLEKFAIKNNIAITNVNENLGGRYSVLSISTFLPLELIGCDWYKIKESALNFYNSENEVNQLKEYLRSLSESVKDKSKLGREKSFS